MYPLGIVTVILMVNVGNGRYKPVTIFRRHSVTQSQAKQLVNQFLNDNPKLATPNLLTTPKWQADVVDLIEDWNERN